MTMNRRSQAGFTLLEILLAVGLLATISLTAITILSSQLENRNRIDVRLTTNHALHAAMSQVYEDLRHLYLPGLEKRSTGVQFRFRDINPVFVWNAMERHFWIFNNQSFIAGKPESNMAQVKYELADAEAAAGETATGKILIRYLDTTLEQDIKSSEDAVKQVLLTDVKDFKVTFLWNCEFNREEWNSTASETNNRAPLMAKIFIEAFVPKTAAQEQSDALAGRTEAQADTTSAESIVYLLSANDHMRPEEKKGDCKWL